MGRRITRQWPILAVALVVGHALVHGYLQSRPGQFAIPTFIAAPRVLFVSTVLAIAAAAYDILYGGWRRLLHGTVIFPIGALVASAFLTVLTYRTYPSSYDDSPAAWCLALPLLDADIAVLQGGRTLDVNAHAGDPSQRYGYDFGVIGRAAAGAGAATNALDSGHGQPVSVPVAGLVVSVTDGIPDRTPGHADSRRWPHAIGNHVVLQVEEGPYLFVARLQSGTIRVRPGDRVVQGEPLAHVGNPDAGVPHLHVHLQDRPGLHRGEGIPLDVCRYEVINWGRTWDTARWVDRGMPTGRDRRQVIRPAPVRAPQ